MTEIFSDAYAASRDAFDPLGDFRGEFHLPLHDGKPQAYFVGNSLGLQPKGARAHVEEVLDKWATRRWKATSPARRSGCPTTSWCATRWRAWSARSPGKWWR
jgi:kynureninase